MHLTLRSSRATGKDSLYTKKKEVREIVARFSKEFQVHVGEFSNNGNHLHLLMQARSGGFKRFLMAISGRIAQLMTKARKGQAQDGQFWDFTPFTRIVEWGRDYVATWRYVRLNQKEAEGVIPYQPRKRRSEILPSARVAASLRSSQ